MQNEFCESFILIQNHIFLSFGISSINFNEFVCVEFKFSYSYDDIFRQMNGNKGNVSGWNEILFK